MITVTNNIIAANIIPAGPSGSAGGVAIISSPVRFINNTVAANAKEGVFVSSSNGVVIVNNIFANNALDGLQNYSINPTTSYVVDYNDYFNNYPNLNGFTSGAHDLYVDPQFASLPPSWVEYYHLQAGSPLTDTGTFSYAPVLDVDSQVRRVAYHNSIGADLPTTQWTVVLPMIFKQWAPP
jgi:hypothetical protein